jgi:hypothetical protein
LERQDWIDEYIRLFKSDRVDLAIAYKSQFIPERLYKYVSLKELRKEKLNCFLLNNIWVASPSNMDDPYDSGLRLDHDVLTDNLLIENFDNFNEFIGTKTEQFTKDEENRIKSSKNISDEIFEIINEKQKNPIEDKATFLSIMNSPYAANI